MARRSQQTDIELIFKAQTKQLTDAIGNLEKKLDDVKSSSEETTGSASGGFFNMAMKIGGAAAALGGMKSALDQVSDTVRTAAQFESLAMRVENLYGDVEKAEAAFKSFVDTAANTPFQLQNVVDAGATLKSFGLNAEETLQSAADLAAFMQVDITEAASAMGRAFAGGVGAANILRERGVLNLLKDFKGIEDLTKLTLPEFREALLDSLSDPAANIAGSADKMAQTFNGAVSNMEDAVDRLKNAFGQKLMPSIKPVVEAIRDMADSMRRFIEDISGLEETVENLKKIGANDAAIKQAEATDKWVKNNERLVELQKEIDDTLKKTTSRDIKKNTDLETLQSRLVKHNQKILELEQQKMTAIQGGYKNTQRNAQKLLDHYNNERSKIIELIKLLGERANLTEEQAKLQAIMTEEIEWSIAPQEEANVAAAEGNALREETIAQINELVRKVPELSGQAARLKEALQVPMPRIEFDDSDVENLMTMNDYLKNINIGLANAVVNGGNLGDAVVGSLKQIAAQVLAMGFTWAMLKLLGASGFLPATALAGDFSSFLVRGMGFIPQRASGGFGSGLTMVGENGPELVNLPSGSRVFNNSESRNMMQGGNSGEIEEVVSSMRELANAIRDGFKVRGEDIELALNRRNRGKM